MDRWRKRRPLKRGDVRKMLTKGAMEEKRVKLKLEIKIVERYSNYKLLGHLGGKEHISPRFWSLLHVLVDVFF